MKITGLVLWVQDNTLSVKFYKKLGFAVVESDDQHSLVRFGSFDIFLESMREEHEFGHDALASDKGRGMYLYIQVDDVDATHADLMRRGLTPHTAPRNWPWGYREFILKDPDGYKLCFWQDIAQ